MLTRLGLFLLVVFCFCTATCCADFEESHELSLSDGTMELKLSYENGPKKKCAHHFWIPAKGRSRSGRGFHVRLESLPQLIDVLERCAKGEVQKPLSFADLVIAPESPGKFRMSYGRSWVIVSTPQISEMVKFWKRERLRPGVFTREYHELLLLKGDTALRACYGRYPNSVSVTCAVGRGPVPGKNSWSPPQFGVRGDEVPKFIKWLNERAKEPDLTKTFQTGAYLLALGKTDTYVMVQTTSKGRFQLSLTEKELKTLLAFFDARP